MLYLLVLLGLFLSQANSVYAQDYVLSDSLWKASKTITPNWTQLGYNDSLWDTSVSPSRGTCSYKFDPTHFTLPMWGPSPKSKGSMYFRRKIAISKPIESALLDVWFDDDGDVYVNNELVVKDASRHLEKEKTRVDVTRRLHKGDNLIAIKGEDVIGGCQWVQFVLTIAYKDGTVLNVPLFKQADRLWADQIYDHAPENELDCGSSIGQCGCSLTSLAMLLRYYGVLTLPSGEAIDPGTLNTYFNSDAQCSISGCVSRGYAYGGIRWNALNQLSKEANEVFGTPKVQLHSVEVFNQDVVRADIEGGNPIIMKAAQFSHWFVAKGFTNETFMINDPAFRDETLNTPRYANTAASIRRYKVVNSDFSLIEVFAKLPAKLLVTDMYGRQTGIDKQGVIIQEIPNSYYGLEEDVSSDELSSSGVMWLYIPQPENGVYTISTPEGIEAAVYAADKDAHEQIFTTEKTVHLYYDHDSADKTEKGVEGLAACGI